MMSELRKASTDHAYFLTFTVVGWIDIFTRSIYCDEIVKNLAHCQKHKTLKIHAYCIMPNHIHLIVSRDEGKLSDFIRDFKSYTAKKIINLVLSNPQESRKDWMLHLFKFHAKYASQNDEYMFWQKTSHPVELFDARIFDQKVEYVHQNPVKAMIVNDPCSYVYSSANPDSPLKIEES